MSPEEKHCMYRKELTFSKLNLMSTRDKDH